MYIINKTKKISENTKLLIYEFKVILDLVSICLKLLYKFKMFKIRKRIYITTS